MPSMLDFLRWSASGGQANVRTICMLACVIVAAAEIASKAFHVGGQTNAWRTLVTIAGSLVIALVVQFSSYDPSGSNSKVQQKRDEPGMIWREDKGLSYYVPLIPEPPGGSKKPLAKYTMKEVAEHNTREDIWIIIDSRVYDVTKFVDKHPGGQLPIVHMAGKDCTDVFANYHVARVYKHQLPPMLVGEVTDCVVPPHVADFREVRQELLRRGLFETDMRSYMKLCTWYLMLFTLAIGCSLHPSSTAVRLLGAVFLGGFWQQFSGLGHDICHSAVSHDFHQDFQVVVAFMFTVGLSPGWWKKNHNTHHVVCNSVEHDPDIQHMPALAVSPKLLEKPFWSTYHQKLFGMDSIAKFCLHHQAVVFYPLMSVARINLYVQGLTHLFTSKDLEYYRKSQLAAYAAFFTWVGALAMSMATWKESLAWLALSHAAAGLLHVQIGISHWSMQTYHGHAYNDANDEWYITQLKTTMNVDTPHYLDWLHIGLQFQIEHHFYPRLPRHNLRIARDMVKAVCKKHGLTYRELGWIDCNKELIRNFQHVSQCARSAKLGSSGFYETAVWDSFNLVG